MAKRRRRRGRFWRWGLAALAVVGMTAVVVVAAGYRLAYQAPTWWASIDPADAQVIDLAERVENVLSTEISRADRDGQTDQDGWQSEPWEIRLSDRDANAWLSARLPRWAENRIEDFRWPVDVRSIQVAFESESIRLGASLLVDENERVLSAEIMPRVEDDGSVWLDVGWMYVGRLPVPAGWLLGAGAADLLPEGMRERPKVVEFGEALAGDRPVMREPIIRLGDGRRVRIVSMELRKGEMLLMCRTEHGGE